jgi:hypothetical protein
VPLTSAYWRRRREFLGELALFAGSTEAELRVFDRLAGEIWVERGADLIHEGARGVEFAVVAEGGVIVERGGRQLAMLGPGDFVGELALLDGRARTATVTAVARTRLLVLGVDEFAAVMRDVPSVRGAVEAAAAVRRDGVPVVPAPAFGVADAAGRRPRRRVLTLPIVGLVVLAVGIVSWWVAEQRTRTTTIGLAEAVASYRAATASEAPPDAAPGGTPPAAGVYTYATDGWESVSVLGGHHRYPSRSYAVVRRTDGCGWEVEHWIIAEHVDRHGRCTTGDVISLTYEGREVKFYGRRDGLRYACDPTAARVPLDAGPGTVTSASCRTGGNEMQLTARRQTDEPIVVAGMPIDAVHLRVDIVMRGRADGTSAVDFWLHPVSGLILKERRVVDIRGDAVFGEVRYREEVALRLESLTPVR